MQLGTRSLRPRTISFVAAAVASIGCLLATLVPIAAQAGTTATLTLDGLSYISFQDEKIIPIPSGSRLTFQFDDPASDGSVRFRIAPEGVEIPPIAVDADRMLRYGLAQTAKGTMSKTPDGRRMSFQAAVAATPEKGRTIVYAMPFTTETTQASNATGDVTMEITGMRLVEGVWYVQLVGATRNDKRAYPKPGTAVYTVLSGQFDTLPEL